jgi:hypothetical protein
METRAEARDYMLGFQFRIRVIGVAVESCTVWFTRKRPSAETAYWCLRMLEITLVWKSGVGVSASKEDADERIVAAVIFPSAAMKYSSLPSERHVG